MNNTESMWEKMYWDQLEITKDLSRRVENWKARFEEELIRNDELTTQIADLCATINDLQNKRDDTTGSERSNEIPDEYDRKAKETHDLLSTCTKKSESTLKLRRQCAMSPNDDEVDHQPYHQQDPSDQSQPDCSEYVPETLLPPIFEYIAIFGLPQGKDFSELSPPLSKSLKAEQRSKSHRANIKPLPFGRTRSTPETNEETGEYRSLLEYLMGDKKKVGSRDEDRPALGERSSSWRFERKSRWFLPTFGSSSSHSSEEDDLEVAHCHDTDSKIYDPEVVASFPQFICHNEINAVMDFCFPSGVTVTRITPKTSNTEINELILGSNHTRRNRNSYVFIVTGGGGTGEEILYAVCVMAGNVRKTSNGGSVHVPQCYCVVSRFPFFELFFKVLWEALAVCRLRLLGKDASLMEDLQKSTNEYSHMLLLQDLFDAASDKDIILKIMHEFQRVMVPQPGELLSFSICHELPLIKFSRPVISSSDDEEAYFVRQWTLSILLSVLSIENVMKLLGCLCTEMQVVIISENPACLSACVLGIITLLRPLIWIGPLIAVLPDRLHEFIDAPVPFIVGIKQLEEDYPSRAGLVLVDVAQDVVHFHPQDLQMLNAIQIPGSENLVAQVHQLTKDLFTSDSADTKERKTLYYPTQQQIEVLENCAELIRHHMTVLYAHAATYEAECLNAHANADVTDTAENCDAFICRLREAQMFSIYQNQLPAAIRHQEKMLQELPFDNSYGDKYLRNRVELWQSFDEDQQGDNLSNNDSASDAGTSSCSSWDL